MRGFDRPVKPEWIYEMIQMLEQGDSLTERKEDLNRVLFELEGDTGKRKVRTVIGRYFLKDLDNRGSRVKDDLIFPLIKGKGFEDAKPLMFFNLLVKAPILQHFSKQLYNYYGGEKPIDADFLRKKAIEKIGERDIASRSLRNFLSTLVDFGILSQEERSTYQWREKLKLSDEDMVHVFRLYSKYYLKSPQISLYELPEHLLFYFRSPDYIDVASKYNNVHWQYVRRTNSAIITFYEQT